MLLRWHKDKDRMPFNLVPRTQREFMGPHISSISSEARRTDLMARWCVDGPWITFLYVWKHLWLQNTTAQHVFLLLLKYYEDYWMGVLITPSVLRDGKQSVIFVNVLHILQETLMFILIGKTTSIMNPSIKENWILVSWYITPGIKNNLLDTLSIPHMR